MGNVAHLKPCAAAAFTLAMLLSGGIAAPVLQRNESQAVHLLHQAALIGCMPAPGLSPQVRRKAAVHAFAQPSSEASGCRNAPFNALVAAHGIPSLDSIMCSLKLGLEHRQLCRGSPWGASRRN